MNDTFNDTVINRYLASKGYHLRHEYLMGSGFFIGWCIETSHFSLTYRLDGDELILCYFVSQVNQTGLKSPVLSLSRFLQDLCSRFIEIKVISAMQAMSGNPDEKERRAGLFDFFQSKGARIFSTEQETWFKLFVNN
ncbi:MULTISPECIES: hypothetical protein [Edwardsiella]|uniref:Secretion system effector SseE n=2 Tax=Edwardsiella anguillarum TaxID=1821960 RepID=A0A076LM48_9GAMM|nr:MULTISPECIES: hypothetical protein [Edwardsiella]AJK93305.1 CesD2 [Edwardsiella sp. EA181011]GAJ68488.1 chaperon CesD2 [Edwardsiella piscicida]AIJ07832.1 Secretion system effector SseE [Edwardsiella anguillarum ET080813]KAB0588197.1 hypothetical protein F7P84_16865 [Edwardsiella anguillarum]RFT03417.1 hypothetical protein CGL57_12010 [Edwardsiella anguillarum]